MAYIVFSTIPLAFFLVAYWASEAGRMWVAAACAVFGLIGLFNLAYTLSVSG